MNIAMVTWVLYIVGFAMYPLVDRLERPQVDPVSVRFESYLFMMLLKSLFWPVMIAVWAFRCCVSCSCRVLAALRRVLTGRGRGEGEWA